MYGQQCWQSGNVPQVDYSGFFSGLASAGIAAAAPHIPGMPQAVANWGQWPVAQPSLRPGNFTLPSRRQSRAPVPAPAAPMGQLQAAPKPSKRQELIDALKEVISPLFDKLMAEIRPPRQVLPAPIVVRREIPVQSTPYERHWVLPEPPVLEVPTVCPSTACPSREPTPADTLTVQVRPLPLFSSSSEDEELMTPESFDPRTPWPDEKSPVRRASRRCHKCGAEQLE
jgi:hypothetical protein